VSDRIAPHLRRPRRPARRGFVTAAGFLLLPVVSLPPVWVMSKPAQSAAVHAGIASDAIREVHRAGEESKREIDRIAAEAKAEGDAILAAALADMDRADNDFTKRLGAGEDEFFRSRRESLQRRKNDPFYAALLKDDPNLSDADRAKNRAEYDAHVARIDEQLSALDAEEAKARAERAARRRPATNPAAGAAGLPAGPATAPAVPAPAPSR